MPWIILHANGEELSRHELVKPIVIGRATDCDIAIKDIMLSRSHCRLEPVPFFASGRQVARQFGDLRFELLVFPRRLFQPGPFLRGRAPDQRDNRQSPCEPASPCQCHGPYPRGEWVV